MIHQHQEIIHYKIKLEFQNYYKEANKYEIERKESQHNSCFQRKDVRQKRLFRDNIEENILKIV